MAVPVDYVSGRPIGMQAETCSDCSDLGYGLFFVDHEPGLEIQRCDICTRHTDDDDAGTAFVQDFLRGMPATVKLVRYILEHCLKEKP